MSALIVTLLVQLSPVDPSVTGGYRRPMECHSASAQAAFDRGLGMLYAFHKHASGLEFARAAALDPKCAMAKWGQAMALGPDINFTTVDAESTKLAQTYLRQARSFARRPVEVGLIEAGLARFASAKPEARTSLDRSYSAAMGRLWQRFPKDPDVGALYAESLLILSPWNNYLPDGTSRPDTVKSITALEAVLRVCPKHLMANHMMIHAVEASPHPERGLAASFALRDLHLSLGHLVHMPSHIYIRTGMYAEGIAANERAIFRDSAFFAKKRPPVPYLAYMAHNRMMLAFAACMNGSYKKAESAMKDFESLIPSAMLKDVAPMFDGYMGSPLDVERRFGKWDKILAAPEPPEYLPITRAGRLANRAIAYAAKHMPVLADSEFKKFLEARKKGSPDALVGLNKASVILDLEENLVRGELAVLRGDFESGLPALEKAVTIEDSLGYDEPPDWIQPVRHTLGAALLHAGKPADAVRVYEEDLRKNPNNGWSLQGIAQSYFALGDMKMANQYRAAYAKVWSHEDDPAGSSCRCIVMAK